MMHYLVSAAGLRRGMDGAIGQAPSRAPPLAKLSAGCLEEDVPDLGALPQGASPVQAFCAGFLVSKTPPRRGLGAPSTGARSTFGYVIQRSEMHSITGRETAVALRSEQEPIHQPGRACSTAPVPRVRTPGQGMAPR